VEQKNSSKQNKIGQLTILYIYIYIHIHIQYTHLKELKILNI